ncbi:NFX1-type zinc finger-containing protein 1-like [Patiria miniata]|uniref:NFX1-type zinc finger-containing protein 1 n=1 Tax=Patiria miniata TaxID=46514 RepID=A0A914B3F1_PATMI|nr:NFX1-type zinc finger-containing protein 1-like [Patiria miniata]
MRDTMSRTEARRRPRTPRHPQEDTGGSEDAEASKPGGENKPPVRGSRLAHSGARPKTATRGGRPGERQKPRSQDHGQRRDFMRKDGDKPGHGRRVDEGADLRRQQSSKTTAKARNRGKGDHEKAARGKGGLGSSTTTEADASEKSTHSTNKTPYEVKRKAKTPPFTDQELQRFMEEEATDVLSQLVKRNEACQSLLNQDEFSDHTLLLTVRVLSCLSYIDPVSEFTYIKELNVVLSMIESSSFLSKHLTRYLVSLPVKEEEETCSLKEEGPTNTDLCLILKLLQLFLQHKPGSYFDVSGALILLERVATTGRLVVDLQQLKTSYNLVEQTQKTAKQRALEKPPPNNFRDIPIFPESRELRQITKPFLRKNIIKGRYESVEHYLDVQFRLLREDFVAPLREGVNEFLSDTSSRPQDIRIYNNVFIRSRTMGENGFVYTLNFDIRPLKRVRWEASKRLLYGSFICLTRDRFQTILCATVENRDTKALEKGLIEVRFLTDAALTKGPFVMAESAAYFEAYRHVLQGLQQMNDLNFPFKRYIVDVAPSVDPPAYLIDNEDTWYDLRLLADEIFNACWGARKVYQQESSDNSDDFDAVFDEYGPENWSGEENWVVSVTPDIKLNPDIPLATVSVPILKLETWPSAEELHLDESQKAALQTALTKEFAIIQGPPGTGKTYIGLKIIQLLLENDSWKLHSESPILVVCYTNHALDQFLEGIIAFGEDNVVRVGSRSSSEVLEPRNLSRLRRERPRLNINRDEKRALHDAEDEIQKSLVKLDIPTKVLLNVDALKNYMTHGEYKALSLLRHELMNQRNAQAEKLLNWLNVVEFEDEDNTEFSGHNQPKQEGGERIDVEDEGRRIQWERQIGDRHGRQTREQRRQRLREETFRENAAYPPQCIKRCGKYHRNLPLVELQKPDVMTDEEASGVERVWSLMIWDRWRLYRLWVRKYIQDHESQLEEHRQQYEELSKKVQDLYVQEDLAILLDANVIGMTTTGAAKCRAVLQRLCPSIVVVEEAAEVLEAHIITTLTEECQHLILIGDHQQLKPNPTVYRLAKQFNLDTSLFERMINNGMPCRSLTHQHRMRPEISNLMKKHFYRNLYDDQSVLKMDNVKGVTHNMFFIDHRHLEDEVDDDRTKSNQYEAEVLVELCKYLLHQGYERSQITILTTYTGQLFCFRRLMDKATFKGVRVCVVDNFQGEENDIILLSLVRSNEEGTIGFLRTSNRVCVALSRARMGFYCIGNGSILKKTQIWQDILATLEAEDRFGASLPLVCQNHPNKITEVTTPGDFKAKVPSGGCGGPCEYRLACGHVCTSLCHPYDPDHVDYECDKPCTQLCKRGEHPCPLRCYQECRPCQKWVQKTMFDCGHTIRVHCHEFDVITCTEPCQRTFADCDHRCPRTCGQSCPHQICPEPCEKTLSCDHPCTKSCGQSCKVYCRVKVKKILPKCGHEVLMACGERAEDFNCHTQVAKTLPRCGHRAVMHCFKDPSSVECKERCEKKLECGHQCPKSCWEPCGLSWMCSFPCEKILACGHQCPNECRMHCPREKSDDALISSSRFVALYSMFCREKCGNTLACGHVCPNKCGEPCPGPEMDRCDKRQFRNIWTKCKKIVKKKLPSCDHLVEVWCHEDVSSVACIRKCEKKLPCGHSCSNKCSEPCPGQFGYLNRPRANKRQGKQRPPSERCEVIVKKALPCGHSTKNMPCWKAESAANKSCDKPCSTALGCGHRCTGNCDSCKQGTQHKPCPKSCNRQLLCGHNCTDSCSSCCSPDCRRCREDLRQGSSQDLTAPSPCKHNFTHQHLKTKACVRPCNQKLPCKHPCIGVCGEPCPPFCNVCDTKSVRSNLPKGQFHPRDMYIYLPDCKHLCQMRSLDKTVAAVKNTLERGCFQIGSILCQKCKVPIRRCTRYNVILKVISDSVEAVRGQCLGKRRKTFGIRSGLVLRTSLGASASMSFEVGRWMRCRHGHVFLRDQDGGDDDAQEPLCPRCPHE